MKSKQNKVSMQVSLHLRYLYQDKGLRGKQLLAVYPKLSKATVYRHATKNINDNIIDKRKFNRGRPSKLTLRARRSILRQIPILRRQYGSFTIRRLRVAAGVRQDACDETIRRVLRAAGYKFLHSRKKGLLRPDDLKKRLKFARKVKKFLSDQFWEEGVSFYLDAAGFQHKYNPNDEAKSSKTMAWRKMNEGLDPYCTAKGMHVGSGGRVAHFMVAIAHKEGVVLCQQYTGKLNGQKFADFIKQHFLQTFNRCKNPTVRRFLQDGCPVQNSKKARKAMYDIGAMKFSIPPRSPDFNPIENVFNFIKEELRTQAIEQNIVRENFENFSIRVKHTLENCPASYIDKTIESMPKRIMMVLKARGRRIKY